MRQRVVRVLVVVTVSFLLLGGSYAVWQPGLDVSDGRADRARNGLWLQHGWLGDDAWFARTGKEARKAEFRSDEAVRSLVANLLQHHVRDVFPHLCPAGPDGRIPDVDPVQTERFLRLSEGLRVMPWIGGVLGGSARIRDAEWRRRFVADAAALLVRWPQLAGVHLNVEPCPSGEPALLVLLDELRAALPAGKVLSVAAYPPPTRFHPHPEVHWEQAYFREVARRSDQVVVMMYDTALRLPKLYEHLLASWTQEVLAWAGEASVLLGLPAYADEGVGYHDPRVENLEHGLRGVHRGLERLGGGPASYQGIAIYSDWEMDACEWAHLRERFLAPRRE